MKDKRRDNIKIEILRHTCFCVIASIMLLIGTLIETYVSTKIFMWSINIC